jgi:hypothetical protein
MYQPITFLPNIELRAQEEAQSGNGIGDVRRQPWLAILNRLKDKQEAGSPKDEMESIPDDDILEVFTYEEGIYYNHSG